MKQRYVHDTGSNTSHTYIPVFMYIEKYNWGECECEICAICHPTNLEVSVHRLM